MVLKNGEMILGHIRIPEKVAMYVKNSLSCEHVDLTNKSKIICDTMRENIFKNVLKNHNVSW